MRIFFFVLAVTVAFASCKGKKTKTEPVTGPVIGDTTSVIGNTPDPVNDTLLLQQTTAAMQAFKDKNFTALAAMVHPDSGVRFSPYAFIDTASDKVLTADWIRKQSGKPEKIVWGTVDPTDETINMTLDAFLQQFVYDVDFIKPENIKVNQFIGGGNTINNLQAIYPGCNFTESHFSGFEKKYEGMDWRSLRLVFKMKDGKYYLVGVVHDEWST